MQDRAGREGVQQWRAIHTMLKLQSKLFVGEFEKSTSAPEVVIVPDSKPSSKEGRTARVKAIDATITLMRRLFWTEGLDPILDAWYSLKKSKDPRFPLMSGVLKPGQVKVDCFVASAEEKEELYQALLQLHAGDLLCVSSDACIKLSVYLNHPKVEGTVNCQTVH